MNFARYSFYCNALRFLIYYPTPHNLAFSQQRDFALSEEKDNDFCWRTPASAAGPHEGR